MIDGVRYVPEPIAAKGEVSFGRLVQAYRDHARMSLDEAAAAIGVSKTYLWIDLRRLANAIEED